MKLFTSNHSSSSSSLLPSSSSSSTLNFGPTFCNSNSSTNTAGCISAILRRILCSGGLPTHPSDQIRELDSMLSIKLKDQELKAKQNTESNTTTSSTISAPSIVAKLMGLEGNTEIPCKSTQSSSLSRSQSMNYVDYIGECKNQMQGKHRRVKSSSSSSLHCEMPTFHFHLHENENFLELSFENGWKKDYSCSAEELKRNKREKVHEESGASGGEFQSFGGNFSVNMVSYEKEYFDSEAVKFSGPMKVKGVTNGEKVKLRRRRKKKKKGKSCCKEEKVEFESECSSEDSSPVSVFDFERETLETGVDSLGVDLSWRRELTPELENELLFVLNTDNNLMVEERNVKAFQKTKKELSKKKENQSQELYAADIWGEICRLVENDFVGSNQIMEPEGIMSKQGEFDSISEDFELEIFDHLLNEFIDQLIL